MARTLTKKQFTRLFSRELQLQEHKQGGHAKYVAPRYPYIFPNSAPRAGPGGKTAAAMIFGQSLIEKQKMRAYYGHMKDYQFKKYVQEAQSRASSNPSDYLMGLLERRLDTTVYRTGFVLSIRMAHQWIHSGNILVNGYPARYRARVVEPGDTIAVHPNFFTFASAMANKVAIKRKRMGLGQSWVVNSDLGILSYLEINRPGLAAIKVREPTSEELFCLRHAARFPELIDPHLHPQLAIAWYK
mmetsp:Transcript_6853/g.12352  ORF Transcript_6853/g.12352 Transcript_6853/m.12352 type:complete len:243 (+) Transcript_6853:109-837(+)